MLGPEHDHWPEEWQMAAVETALRLHGEGRTLKDAIELAVNLTRQQEATWSGQQQSQAQRRSRP